MQQRQLLHAQRGDVLQAARQHAWPGQREYQMHRQRRRRWLVESTDIKQRLILADGKHLTPAQQAILDAKGQLVSHTGTLNIAQMSQAPRAAHPGEMGVYDVVG